MTGSSILRKQTSSAMRCSLPGGHVFTHFSLLSTVSWCKVREHCYHLANKETEARHTVTECTLTPATL